LDYFTWYGPIALMSIIGLIFMLFTLYRLYSVTRGISMMTQYVRPLLFLISFFAIFFWFFIWRIEYSYQSNAWAASYTDWQICIAQHTVAYCGESPKDHLATWTWYGFHFFLSSQGLILTLTWGTQL